MDSIVLMFARNGEKQKNEVMMGERVTLQLHVVTRMKNSVTVLTGSD